MNIVLDTNCLLMSLSRRSAYYPVWRDFVDGKYTLCVTNEILAEYEEILTQKVGPEIASNVITAILDLPNTKMVQVYYHLHLITADPFSSAHLRSLTSWTDLQVVVPARASISSRTLCAKADALSNMPYLPSSRHSPSCGNRSILSPFIESFGLTMQR